MLVVGEAHGLAGQHAAARHEHVVAAVDEDVLDVVVAQQVLQRPQAGQLLGQRCGHLAQLALVDGHPAQAHEAGHLDIHEFLDGGAGPAAELGAEFLDARQQVFVGLVLDVLEAFGRDEFAAARGAEFHGWRHDHDVCQLSTTLVKRCTPGSQLASQLLCRARGASLPASSRSTSVCTART